MNRRVWLLAELVGLFGVLPVAVLLWPGRKPVLPAIGLLAIAALLLLLRDPTFDRRRLWRWRRVRGELPAMFGRLALAGLGMASLVPLLPHAEFFHLPRHRPGLWLAIITLYPLLSVYPQELAYRALIFHRYRLILPRPWHRIAISALAFGWAHVVLMNWVAVAFCLVGGLLFGLTYHRTRSLPAASLEHALYGDLIFTLGLGLYFYAGGPVANAG